MDRNTIAKPSVFHQLIYILTIKIKIMSNRILKTSLISIRQYGNNKNQIEKWAMYRVRSKNGQKYKKKVQYHQ